MEGNQGGRGGQSPLQANDMFNGLIDAMSIYRQRIFSWESRVPDPVIWLLLFGALIAMSAIGFFGGLETIVAFRRGSR